MADSKPNSDPAIARSTLIRLLMDLDKWKITARALREGKAALHWIRNCDASEFEIIDYIHDQLVDGFPIESVLLGDPPGSTGIGWVMRNPDGRDTYIKLKIEQDGIEDIAIILSCHTSVHPKK